MSVVRRYVAPDGVTLVADEAGPEGAPTVILLHGGGQTRHSWSGAMRALVGRGYRVINVDGRGHGDSDWSEAGRYSLDDRVDDLRVITAGITGPFALVGASLGGMTAIHAAASGLAPSALVLVDIVPTPEPAGIDRIVTFMRGTSAGFDTIEDVVAAVTAYNPHRPRPRDSSGLRRNLREREDGRLYWHWDPRIVSTRPEDIHAMVERSARMLGRRLEMGVLVVRGMSSDVVSDSSVAAFRKILPTLEVADVAGAGHMVSGDRNDAFNASVLEFLDRRMPVAAET
ncbi:alpha/beta fold hydrolase [Novosphingobium tardum]|uniref:Alpha/beta fold hydrolase n=1 Tax=Novosphingobium tardum TaxID=1538021 RepID=A0ABV8RR59_9SPHN